MNDVTRLFRALMELTATGTVDQQTLMALLSDHPGVDCSKLGLDYHAVLARYDLCRSIPQGNSWKTIYPGDPHWKKGVPWNDPS